MKKHAVGLIGAARRRLVTVYTSLDGDNRSLRCKRDAWAVATVDQREGCVEKKIDDAAVFGVLAARHFGDQVSDLRPDTGQRRGGSKEGIEYGWAHGRLNGASFGHLAR
ncbi:hypothetical protein D3C80_719750 [compost metagenome]